MYIKNIIDVDNFSFIDKIKKNKNRGTLGNFKSLF